MLEKWVLFHLKNHNLKSISIVGGVACNSIIARQFGLLCQEMNISLFIPERKYCCDNSDMIAFVASKKIERGLFEVNLYDQSIFNAIC
jgi:tRNA A37 threonylcarbamoyltransferase TsaD